MIGLSEATLLIDSSNYTAKQIRYIYGDVENKKKGELNTLLDKAFLLNDWHVVDELLNRYTTFMSS